MTAKEKEMNRCDDHRVLKCVHEKETMMKTFWLALALFGQKAQLLARPVCFVRQKNKSGVKTYACMIQNGTVVRRSAAVGIVFIGRLL